MDRLLAAAVAGPVVGADPIAGPDVVGWGNLFHPKFHKLKKGLVILEIATVDSLVYLLRSYKDALV